MAKIRHRTFEMFEGLQEASDALTTKSARVNAHSLDPDLWRFHQLDVAILPSGIVHVTFKSASDSDSTSQIEKDLSDLSGCLTNASRVLLDFAGLSEFDSDAIGKLSDFENRLRAKGSRVVLCNVEPTVHASFFPNLSPNAQRSV